MYPRAEYIAQRGEGPTRQEAELTALGAVSFYFESEINAEESGRRSWTEQNGVTNTESRTETNTLVRSQTRLVAVRYAEDPWFNPAARTWTTVAYIDRGEAWAVYEPEAAKVRDRLLSLFAAAEAESEPFPRSLRFGAAAGYGESAEFNAIRGFAQVLYPAKAQVLFDEADGIRSVLPERIDSARRNATVFIDCPADLDGLIYQAAAAALGAEGFPVERNRNTASCVCRIRVDAGTQKIESGIFYNPSLTGTVNGTSGAVFSFTAKAPRQSAINPEVAKRRAYTALAAALGEAFSGELNRQRASYGSFNN
ncbi:MAG: hypothetical protein LBO65_06890 [Spirochaetaceae bacterium]|nr:hypothetical protein [Spirochaetaceae bacterium]